MSKKLTVRQGENRLNKYCDKMGYTDVCGFHNNAYTLNDITYTLELNSKIWNVKINLNTGKIMEL